MQCIVIRRGIAGARENKRPFRIQHDAATAAMASRQPALLRKQADRASCASCGCEALLEAV